MLKTFHKPLFGSIGVIAVLSAVYGTVYAADTAAPAGEHEWAVPVSADSDQIGVWATDGGKRIFLPESGSEPVGTEGGNQGGNQGQPLGQSGGNQGQPLGQSEGQSGSALRGNQGQPLK